MSFLDSIFNNPSIRKAALSNLTKVMKENNVTQVLVKLNPVTEELDLEFISSEQVIIPASDLEMYKNAIIKNIDL